MKQGYGAKSTPMKPLNESPSEKEGKLQEPHPWRQGLPLNESPSEKEGKSVDSNPAEVAATPSMKAPPKRKGNTSCP